MTLLIDGLFVLPDDTVAVLLSSRIESDDHLHVVEQQLAAVASGRGATAASAFSVSPSLNASTRLNHTLA